MKKLPLIDHLSHVKEKILLLDVLTELDIASKQMNYTMESVLFESKNNFVLLIHIYIY